MHVHWSRIRNPLLIIHFLIQVRISPTTQTYEMFIVTLVGISCVLLRSRVIKAHEPPALTVACVELSPQLAQRGAELKQQRDKPAHPPALNQSRDRPRSVPQFLALSGVDAHHTQLLPHKEQTGL